MRENELSRLVIGAAIEVHRELGPGLLEVAYEHCLAVELARRGVPLQRQVAVPVVYKGEAIDCTFRIDLLVDGLVVVELKAVDTLMPVHEAQVLTYLKLTGCRLGLLMNFNDVLLRKGVKRLVNGL